MAETYFRQVRSFAHPRMYGRYGAGSSLTPGTTDYGGGGGDPGSVIAKAMGDISTRIQAQQAQARQDAIVNQMMNTRNPPRAGLVTNAAGQGQGINPRTGQPFSFNVSPLANRLGTQTGVPFTGGMGDLQAQANAQRLMNEVDPVGAAVARANAAVAASRITGYPATGAGSRGGTTRVARGGGGGGTARVATGRQPAPGKPQPYQPNTENDPHNYTMDKMRADFDSVYGKGAFDKVNPQLGNIKNSTDQVPQFNAQGKPLLDANGKQVMGSPQNGLVRDPQGNIALLQNGTPTVSIGANDIADKWQGRFNTARYNSNLAPLNLMPPSSKFSATNPPPDGSPVPTPGSAQNPFTPKDTWGINSVPYGAHFYDPRDGQMYTRQSLQQKQDAQRALALQTQGMIGGDRPNIGSVGQPDELGNALLSGDERRIKNALVAAPDDQTDDLGKALLKGDDQGVIDALNIPGQPTGGEYGIPSQFATGTQGGPGPSDFYPGSAAVSQPSDQGGGFAGGGGTTGRGGATGGWGEGSSPAATPGPSALASPSDLYSGSAALSYLAPLAATPPPAQPPDVSPQVTGQAANAASAQPTPTPEQQIVGMPGENPAQLPVASYLGGY